ncbi:MAG: ORF6N domain-containing protein [Pyrinomonadaceae bacterium]
MNKSAAIISVEQIENMILLVRGEKVILDSALAALYGVSTMRLNERVSRNKRRFPSDFVFRLAKDEWKSLISQIAISKTGRGGRRTLPYVFTEHGAIMAANVLSSQQAVEVSVQVVRAFVRLRQILTSNLELARKLDQLEKKYDHQFKVVFQAIRQLMEPPPPKTKPIGFRPKELK